MAGINVSGVVRTLEIKKSKIIKIAHVTTVDTSVRFLLFNQLLYLKKRKFNVSVVCSNGEWVEEITRAGIPVENIEMKRKISPFSDFLALISLYRYFKKNRFDIVHTHTPKPGLLGQLAAKFAGVPVVINTVHGFYFHDNMSPISRKFYILMEKIAALCSDSILSQNPEDVKTAIDEHICSKEQINYLGNGIDIRFFDPTRFSTEEIVMKRQEIKILQDENVVGFVGRLVKEKGIFEFFEAARIIKKAIPNTKILIVGPAEKDKKDAIDPSMVKDFGLESEVIFLGMRTDMPELYAVMDIFVLPSYREGFPRSPMEAAAMGKPVILTNIRGCRQVVKDGATGMLVPVNNFEKLAESIIELLSNKGKAKKMGEAGRKLAESAFDEQKVFEKVDKEYRRLLRKKGLISI